MRGKQLRYGGTAAAFTVSFVALVIIVNIIFTALATKYRWYIDMSTKELFSLSDKTVEILGDVENDVTIIFCMDKDELDADAAMFYIHNTAQNLGNKFPNIKIEYRDALRELEYLKQYTTESSNTVTTTSVIIKSGSEYRKYDSESFFVIDSDNSVYAYKGENTFASAILQVTAAEEMPIVYFTNGHMESLTGDVSTFIRLIGDAGFDVRVIDLSTEEIDPDARLLIINDPKTDFGGELEAHVGKSEIEKIDEFLDGFGSMMVFASPEYAGKLTNLSEFLTEWGVELSPGVTVKETGNASRSTDGFTIVGQYNTSENDLAASIYRNISNIAGGDNQTLPLVVFREASPIKHCWPTDEKTTPDLSNRFVFDVFTTTPEANLYSGGELIDDPEAELVGGEGRVADENGRYSLMTITQEYKLIDNNPYTSYVVVSGTPTFIDSDYLNKNVYKNRDVIYSCLIALTKENVPAGIEWKEFESYDLSITTGQADSWTYSLILVMPIITIAACIVVTVRRKYK